MKPLDWQGFNKLRFDTNLKSSNNLISLFFSSSERIKASGKKVVVKTPLFPADIIYAAGALAYDSFTHEAIAHAVIENNPGLIREAVNAGLSWDSNPWYLMMLGAVVSGKSDVTIDACLTACGCWDDHAKRCWQLMAEAARSPLHFWEVPRFDSETEEWAVKYLVKEFEDLFDWLAVQTGCEVTEDSLTESVKSGNMLRQDLMEITRMLQLPKVPISALEYYLIHTMLDDHAQNPELLHDNYRVLIQELEERVSKSINAPGLTEKPLRIYLMGEETLEMRIWNVIEDYGGVLVGCDSRFSLYYEPIKEDGSVIENLAVWTWRMPCNLPTEARIEATIPHIKQQKPDAIIISSVAGSRTTSDAEKYTRDLINEELGLPILSLATGLPLENIESIDRQISTFIEKNTG